MKNVEIPKSLRYEWLSLEVDSYVVHVSFRTHDAENRALVENRKFLGKTGQFTVMLDSPHVSSGKQHLHLFARGNELLAVNVDGSSHDGSRGQQIPNKVADFLIKKLPWIQLPPGNLIEWVDATLQGELTLQVLKG